MVAHTVFSVGPYALINLHSLLHWLTSSFGQASPATTTVLRAGAGRFGTFIRTEGGSVTASMSCVTINSRTFSGCCALVPEIKTSFAPDVSAINQSQVAASKLNEANCNTDAPASTCRFLF